jgi:ABC-type multidrug transport system fused ATPase/permease subunit
MYMGRLAASCWNGYSGLSSTVITGQFYWNTNASQILHTVSLGNILRCPIAFFDITPVGWVLNRFSKDVDSMDNALPLALTDVQCIF